MTYLNSISARYFFFILFIFSINTYAEEADILAPTAPPIAASSYLLEDFNSGKIIAENRSDTKLAPASLTKILTVYVVFNEIKNGHLKLDDKVTISENAWKTSGSKMFVKVNDQVNVEDLLKGIIIQSGNDASVAIAEHVGGNEAAFAQLMNQHAARLGMVNSHFQNSDGLPSDGHYTTAHDLAILTRALIKEFPQYYPWFSIQEFTYNKITQKNRNLLLSRDQSVDGVKTGHTDEAGFCLVASALRNGMRLISVVMGTENEKARATENQTLLNYGYRFFDSKRVFEGKKSLQESRIWKGSTDTVQIGLLDDLYVLIPRRDNLEIKSSFNINPQILAPIKTGDKLGSVTVSLKDEILATNDLVALADIEKGGFFRQMYDNVLMMVGKNDGK